MDRIEALNELELDLNLKYTEEDLKKQYRFLIKKYHPDIHPENKKEYEEKTKKINIAYEHLMKKSESQNVEEMFEKMFRHFNMGNDPFVNHFHQNSEESARRMRDSFINKIKSPIGPKSLNLTVDIPIENLLIKGEKKYVVTIDFINNCNNCNGIKILFNHNSQKCGACGGIGVRKISPAPNVVHITTCNICGGMGIIYQQCNYCDQFGFTHTPKQIEIPLVSKNGIKVTHNIDGFGLPSKNVNPEERGSLNICYNYKPNDIFIVSYFENKCYLANNKFIPINFSDILKRKNIYVPIYSYKKNEIIQKKIKLPEEVSFYTDIIPSSLEFSFLVNNIGIEIDGKSEPFLVRTKINENIK